MKDFAVILSISMKGFVWRWMVALCVFTEIVAAQHNVASGNERNIAKEGTCSQSTDLDANSICTGAIDGNRHPHTKCAHTAANDPDPHLSVFLKHRYFIHKLVFVARTNSCKRKLWGPRCDQPCDAGCAECKASASKCLECEVGYWGPNTCAKCGEGCVSGNCSFANGTCQCREHWAPPKCESCSAGYWGDNCSATCGQGCRNTCNAKDGQCDCQPGWKPPRCEGCIDGYWGGKCENTCPPNCRSCKKTDGQCEVTLPPIAASPPSEKKFPIWAAALIALGILGLIALCVFLVCLACRKRRKDQSPAQAPEGASKENPEGEEAEGEGEGNSQAEQSAEGTEESQQASEGGEAAPEE